MHIGKKNWYIHKYKAGDYVISMLHCCFNSIDTNFKSKPSLHTYLLVEELITVLVIQPKLIR